MIKVPNGTYDVNIDIGNFENTSKVWFQINGTVPKGVPFVLPSNTSKEISHNVQTTSKQLIFTARCMEDDETKCKNSLTIILALSVQVASKAANADEDNVGPRIELSYKSGMGGSCKAKPVGCVFEKDELPAIFCPGFIIKIPGTVKEKDVACKHKCIKKYYKDNNDCRANCPVKCTSDFRCVVE